MNSIFSIITFIGVIVLFVVKYREAFSKLNKLQKVGVIVSYIIIITGAGICIYYGTALITAKIENRLLELIIDIIVVVATLALAVSTLNQLLNKITKGVFPKIS